MKPSDDQLRAAREWLAINKRPPLTSSDRENWRGAGLEPRVNSLAALLAAREAAVDRAAYRRGWGDGEESMRERALERERSGAQWNGVTEFYGALPIRALEPPSGEGEP